MQMCPRCSAAIDAGWTQCPICGQPVAVGPTDPTTVYGAPPVAAPPPPPPVARSYAPPPGYGQPYAPAPGYGQGYGAHPVPMGVPYGVGRSPKSKAVAAVLCFFLGSLGVHRFYTGQVGLGLALLLTTLIAAPLTCGLSLIATGVWVTVDFILILCGAVTDESGRPLS